MPNLKILFINDAHPILEQQLLKLGYECEVDITSSPKEIAVKLPQYIGVVLRSRISMDKKLMDEGTNLKFIAREGVGLEHIDTVYAQTKGIEIINSPEGSKDAVGEQALGMLLAMMNNLVRADAQVRMGKWIREANRATEIKGKTVGIIGYGNMGQSFARKISGLEATVLAYDKYRTNYGDRFAKAVTLETLFLESDIVSLHIPFMEGNYHFVNDAFLSSFEKNIWLINTARGLVLNTADLVKHLKTGKVRGAALDVLEYEEQSFAEVHFADLPAAFHELIVMDNVILAPHIAGWSFESKAGHARVLAEKITAFLRTVNW